MPSVTARVCVQCHDVVHVFREALFHLSHEFSYARGCMHRVGTGQLIRGDDCAGLSVQTSSNAVVLRAEFDSRHVLDAHDATVRRFAHDDLPEFFRRGQPALRENRVGKLLSLGRGFSAGLSCRVHGILRLNGADNFCNSDTQFCELVRSDPQPHRILARAEYLHVADARRARKWIGDIDERVVGQKSGVVGTVRRIQGQ